MAIRYLSLWIKSYSFNVWWR